MGKEMKRTVCGLIVDSCDSCGIIQEASTSEDSTRTKERESLQARHVL